MYLQFAWRNVWRNKRRTAIILAAVIIGIWSMILLGSLMRGIAVGMIQNGIDTLTGHLQIHRNGYRNDPAIENSISDPNLVVEAIRNKLPVGALWSLRVRVNAVASNARGRRSRSSSHSSSSEARGNGRWPRPATSSMISI